MVSELRISRSSEAHCVSPLCYRTPLSMRTEEFDSGRYETSTSLLPVLLNIGFQFIICHFYRYLFLSPLSHALSLSLALNSIHSNPPQPYSFIFIYIFILISQTRFGSYLSGAPSRGGWVRVLCQKTAGNNIQCT